MSANANSLDTKNYAQLVARILTDLGIKPETFTSGNLKVKTPISGEYIGCVATNHIKDVDQTIDLAEKAYLLWRNVPAPKRGELIRLFGEELRYHRQELGILVTLECGKILQEGLGEIQEMIDICDFAVGLSRQLYGLVIASERPGHKMMETWHPLGVIGLITPFNFPAAVWAWNFVLAIVCGNSTIWKPSKKTPLIALACQHLFKISCQKFGQAPDYLSVTIQGEYEITNCLIDSPKVPLISATGSTEMGRHVGQRLGLRFGKSLLELGGNNAMIVTPSADLDLVLRAITFSAVGTAGQRCTTLRRLIIHHSLKNILISKLKKIYESIKLGNPLEQGILCGPLIDKASFDRMQWSLQQAKEQGGTVFGGERILKESYPNAYYVRPALVEMPEQSDIVKHETFAPILYILTYETLEEAIILNNDVPQGLSSCIFTQNLQETEVFLSSCGSDCGIANVNIGPSGAEIGGAFGGDKETGGGRESGTDSWRNYMRRATNTINYSKDLPLAQGIQFDL